MHDQPEKPPSVPPGAVYSSERGGWELCEHDDRGRRHGECLLYRDDGTLWMRARYERGKLAGAFSGYHPNGELSQRGFYVNGDLDGVVVKLVSDSPGSEPLRGCCVPSGATELRSSYREGRLLRQVFHDRNGQPLASDGTPWPARAPSVPEDAEYDVANGSWSARTESDALEIIHYYAVDGKITEEVAYHGGVKQWQRLFDGEGRLQHELAFDADGRAHGASFVRYEPAETPYLDARVVSERGSFAHGQPSGTWHFFDSSGAVIHSLSRGDALGDLGAALHAMQREYSAALGCDARSEQAAELAAAGRVREALCLAASAAALAKDATRFRALLAAHVLPLRPEVAARRADALTSSASVTPEAALDHLLLGTDAAAALRTLAAVLPGQPLFARDLVDAALLLAPERRLIHVTRALIRLELGDRDGALEDAEHAARESVAAARFVQDFTRIHFPEFGFWPARELPAADPELMPVTIEQPLEAVRRGALVYAARLAELRRRLNAVAGEQSWLPPDTSRLLRGAAVELRRFTATIVDETEEGSESSDVEIDETLELSGESSVPALMRRARADWAALGWLCWAAGLDDIALPDELDVPALFPAAVNQSAQRCWRAHDRLSTGGLRALTQGIPGFSWEGDEIDNFHPRLVEVAAAEYLEVRAMFFWLIFAENVSPFQSDLRKV